MWFGIYTVSATEAVVVMVRSQMEIQVEHLDGQLKAADAILDPSEARSSQVARLQDEREERQSAIDQLNTWNKVVRIARWPMPKTSETVDLLGRMHSREGDINLMDLFVRGKVTLGPDGKPLKRPASRDDERVQERVIKEASRNSPTFIIGTSLLFELVMLTAAAWIFCSRD